MGVDMRREGLEEWLEGADEIEHWERCCERRNGHVRWRWLSHRGEIESRAGKEVDGDSWRQKRGFDVEGSLA